MTRNLTFISTDTCRIFHFSWLPWRINKLLEKYVSIYSTHFKPSGKKALYVFLMYPPPLRKFASFRSPYPSEFPWPSVGGGGYGYFLEPHNNKLLFHVLYTSQWNNFSHHEIFIFQGYAKKTHAFHLFVSLLLECRKTSHHHQLEKMYPHCHYCHHLHPFLHPYVLSLRYWPTCYPPRKKSRRKLKQHCAMICEHIWFFWTKHLTAANTAWHIRNYEV